MVFFRDQTLTPEQHIRLARQFGDINVNRFFSHAEGYPEIALVVKEPQQTKNIGGGWHTDHSYDQVPAMGSLLYARETPPTGGDTLFASMYAAYDALSDGLKQTLAGLRAVHSSRHVFGAEAGGDGRPVPQSRGPGDAGRGAPGGDHASRQRAEGAVREPRLHAALRGLDGRGVASRCCRSCTSTRFGRSSSTASPGSLARWRSGTIAPRGTTR